MPYKDPEQDRAWRRAYRASHPEEARVYARAYARAHPQKYRPAAAAGKANRSARKAGVPDRITPADVRAVWEAPSCVYCGGDGIGLDHVIPLSRGGANDRSNLVRCCPSCNHRKGARTPEEWRPAL